MGKDGERTERSRRRKDASDDEERRKERKGRRSRREEESDDDEDRSEDEDEQKNTDKRKKKSGESRRKNVSEDSEEEEREKRRKRKKSRKRDSDSEEDESEDESSDEDRKKRKKSKKKSSRRKKKRSSYSKRRHESSDESSEESESSDDDVDDEEAALKVPEEELREYLARKAQKKAQKLAKKLRQKTVSGYTNDSNPFGDSNLTETFVWRKKIEKDVLKGNLDPREMTLKKEKERLASRTDEIEKVKKRREERLLEKARHEEEMAMLARERARAEFQDWEEKEDEYHFEQSKIRSEIRLKEGRAKPIDVLARNLHLSDDFDVEINEPYKIYKGLTVKEMEELKEDIKLYLEFDRKDPLHIEFWTSMMVVCNHEIAEGTRRDILDRAKVRGEEPPPEVLAEDRGLHNAVNAEVDTTLATKTSKELAEMEDNIQHQMESGGAKLVEYWESVLKRLKVFKAKARLREIHAELLRRHLTMLQSVDEQAQNKEEVVEAGKDAAVSEWDRDDVGEGDAAAATGEAGSFSPDLMTEEEAAAEGLIVDEEPKAKPEAGAGGFSPELMHEGEAEEAVDPEADRAEQEQKRAAIMQQRMQAAGPSALSGPKPGSGADLTAAERAQAMKMMGPSEGDALLGQGAEVNLESQVYWWHDKYRPRKPKYFNRVHTGYEWNKYNQTHYDHDNPPPKIVQGYKFNIFYPDLIDRSKAPTYSIDKDGSAGETCLIRFHAGPPYEDIAFRIVNKEWEYSHKRGFKCTFDRGILHVYFNFKRYRYRR